MVEEKSDSERIAAITHNDKIVSSGEEDTAYVRLDTLDLALVPQPSNFRDDPLVRRVAYVA